MPSLLRSRTSRWAVPAVAIAAVGAAVGFGSVMAGASSPDLPERTAADLLASVADSEQPFSGTVVQTSRLGLPDLPEAVTEGAGPIALLTGSHTARIWYSSPERARFALTGNLDETNIIRDGDDVWVWSSSTNTAEHAVVPSRDGMDHATPVPEAISPQAAAEALLAAVDPTTEVTVDGTAEVAGRAAYELVLAPRDGGSLVDDVRLAVDSETSMPLRMQVNADGADEPAFEVAFTSVTMGEPSDDVFRFNPPPGATVDEHDLSDLRGHDDAKTGDLSTRNTAVTPPTVIGEGWTSVVVIPDVTMPDSDETGLVEALLGSASRVSGPYGSGRLLETELVSALLLDDGRLLVGAVTSDVLEQAAEGLDS